MIYYLHQYWTIVNWIPRNELQWNRNQNTQTCVKKIHFKNVLCKLAAILSRWVKCIWFWVLKFRLCCELISCHGYSELASCAPYARNQNLWIFLFLTKRSESQTPHYHWMHWRLLRWQPPTLPMIIKQLVSQPFHYNLGQHSQWPPTFENNWQPDKIFFGTMYKAFRIHNRSGVCPVIYWTYPMMTYDTTCYTLSNDTVRPERNGRPFADSTLNCIFFKEIYCILIKISLKYVPWGQIDNKSALFQKMACPLAVDKSLPEPTMISSLMHTVLLGLHGVTTANKNISCALVGS